MALETLKGVKEIGGFKVAQHEGNPKLTHDGEFVTVDHDDNSIMFEIQDGPIKKNGVNGCDISTIIEAAKLMLVGINKKESHSPHKNNAIAHLFSAMSCLEHDILGSNRRNQSALI